MQDQAIEECWTMFHRDHCDISVDRMLRNPMLRNDLLEAARLVAPDTAEEQFPWKLMGPQRRKQPWKNPQISPAECPNVSKTFAIFVLILFEHHHDKLRTY